MTTPIVPSITDDELVSIENLSEYLKDYGCTQQVLTLREVQGLTGRLRAAEKDAARYRFIRSEDTKPGFLSSDPGKAKYLDEYLVCASVMDARIDTAMEQSK